MSSLRDGTPTYQKLKALLVGNSFAPRERLAINDLALRVGVSATPGLEPSNGLHAEGLLPRVPNRGFFPTGPNLQETMEPYQIVFLILGDSIHRGRTFPVPPRGESPAWPLGDGDG